MKIKHVFLYILFLVFATEASAQIPISTVKKTRNDSTFYLHTVQKKQTLFSISRAYKISVKEIQKINGLSSPEAIKEGQVLYIPAPQTGGSDFLHLKIEPGHTLFSLSQKYGISMTEIIKHNPNAAHGLKVGEILKIPQKQKAADKPQYTVKDGDTLFSLSKKFGISMEEIIRMNPQLKDGLKAGQTLRIPGGKVPGDAKPVFTPDNDTAPIPVLSGDCAKKDFPPNKAFEVALMLPLFLDDNKVYLERYKSAKDKMYFANTKQFFEIYNGILTALHDLKKEGISVHMHVYDTKKDSVEVKRLMLKPEMRKMDLVIGPVYSQNIKVAARYARNYGVHLVSPLSRNEDLLNDNSSVLQVVPAHEDGAEHIARTLQARNDIKRLIIVHNGSKRERELTQIYKKLLQKDSANIREVTFGITGKNSFGIMDKAIVKDIKNYIIVPSNDEVFASRILNRLYILSKNHTFEVWGSNHWMNFQNVGLDQIRDLNIRMVSPFFVDYDSPKTQSVIQLYREAFKTEPSAFSFKGYDVCRFFVEMLKSYGKDFAGCLTSEEAENYEGVIQQFRFAPRGSGISNTHSFILHYDEDFSLKELNE